MQDENSSNHSNSTESVEPTKSVESVDATGSVDSTESMESTEIVNPTQSSLENSDSSNIDHLELGLLKQELEAANITIGRKLREIRQSARFTQQEVGRIIGASAQKIAQYEAGEAGVAIVELFKISEELGADIRYFLCGANHY